MTRLLRTVLLAVFGFLLLLVTGLGLLVMRVDPNDYKDELRKLAHEQAGIELSLDGELAWSFYPVLGFRLKDAGGNFGNESTPLLHIDDLSMGLRLLPLLSRKIEVDALEISGLQLKLVVNNKGQNNWTPIPSSKPSASAASGLTPVEQKTPVPALFIPELRVRNSQLRYEDQVSKQRYSFDLNELTLQNVRLDTPFPVLFKGRLSDQAGLDLELTLATQLKVESGGKKITADALELQSQIKGKTAVPLLVELQGALVFDQSADRLELTLSRVQSAAFAAMADVQVTSLSQSPAFKGQLRSETFNAKTLLENLAITPPVMQDNSALERIKVDLSFSGDSKQLSVDPLTLKLDDSTISGNLAILDLASQALRFAFTLDHIDLDRYLPPPSKQSAATASDARLNAPAAPANTALLPVDTLRKLRASGRFKANELIVNKVSIRDLVLAIEAKNGDVQVTQLQAKAWQGSLNGSAGLDVRGSQPQWRSRIEAQNVLMEEVLRSVTPKALLSGRSGFTLQLASQGNDVDNLLKAAVGQVDLSLQEGLLHGVNLNGLASAALSEKLGTAANLVPDYQQRLPKALKEDTALHDVLVHMNIEDGHLILPDVKARTDQGHVQARADVDLLQQGFDAHLGVVLAALSDNHYFKDTAWPLRCQGKFNEALQSSCRPDSQAMGDIIQKAGSQAMRAKAVEKVGEKLGVSGADEAAVKQEAKQKAKDKLNEELGKKFNKFLQRN